MIDIALTAEFSLVAGGGRWAAEAGLRSAGLWDSFLARPVWGVWGRSASASGGELRDAWRPGRAATDGDDRWGNSAHGAAVMDAFAVIQCWLRQGPNGWSACQEGTGCSAASALARSGDCPGWAPGDLERPPEVAARDRGLKPASSPAANVRGDLVMGQPGLYGLRLRARFPPIND